LEESCLVAYYLPPFSKHLEKGVNIKEIKQQKYFCNITPAKPQQTHRENEDAEDL